MAHKNTKDDLNRSEKKCNELETKLDSAEFEISILKFESKNSTADREILGNALDELKGNNFKLSQALIKNRMGLLMDRLMLKERFISNMYQIT